MRQANCVLAGGQWQDWASDLERLAREPQVFCKLSGLWTLVLDQVARQAYRL